MWLATKHAAVTKGRGRQAPVPVNPTTLKDLDEYNALREEFPDVEAPSADMYGQPDQVAHLKLLRELKQQAEMEPEPPAPDEPSSPPSDLPRRVPRNRPLAERDPGWYVSPESQSAGYGVPPMPRRRPGDSLRPSHGPGYAPPQQSIQDWVRWLRSKGIEVDHTLQRPDAARPHRGYTTGPEIWMPFVDAPGYSGRQMVAAFIKRAISDRSHQTMLDGGWTFHGGQYPGQMGSWYQKTIGDRTHVIVKDDDWIHNSAPAGSEPNEFGELPVDQNPMGFGKLSDAVMYANGIKHNIKHQITRPWKSDFPKYNSWEEK